jgi:hypothetical protein
MTCEEAREQYNMWLGTRRAKEMPSELSGHIQSCAECAVYCAEIGEIDWALSHLPEVEIPDDLIPPELLETPARSVPDWKDLALSAALTLVLGSAVWVLSHDYSFAMQFAAKVVITTTGFYIAGTNRLELFIGLPEILPWRFGRVAVT